MATGQFGGSSLPDIAVANYSKGGLKIFIQQVNGSFQAQATSPPTGINPRYIATADFNGDGLTDLAVANIAYHTG